MPDQRGFTLTELLVTMAVLAILVSLLLPVMESVQEHGRQTACSSNQRQLVAAITTWAQDHEDVFPTVEDVWSDLHINAGVLHCPTEQAKRDSAATPDEKDARRNDYLYSSFLARHAQGAVKYPLHELVTADSLHLSHQVGQLRCENILYTPDDLSLRHANGYIGSYCDGHVAMLREPPPYWAIEVSSVEEFAQQVLHAASPTLVCFWSTAQAGTSPLEAQCSTAAKLLVTSDIARSYRGKLKIVTIKADDCPQLAACYAPTPRDSSLRYPATMLFNNGAIQSRIPGPSATSATTAAQEIARMYRQIMTLASALPQ